MNDFSTPRLRMLAAAVAIGLPLAFSGSAPAQDKAKGDERPETAPGQTKPAGEPASPTKPEAAQKGQDTAAANKAKPKKAGKAEKTKKAKKAKKNKGAKGNSGVAKGKTTICHSTGSDTNPYVTITVSNAALKAHKRHHDGADIVPAPAEGCPKGTEQAKAPQAAKAPKTAAKGEHGQKKVTICHATGSDTNPYVKITIAEPAVEAHKRHQDGEDIIPAPEGDCPAQAAAAATTTAKGTRTAAPAPAVAQVPAVAVLGAVATLTTPNAAAPAVANAAPQGAVLGETATLPTTAKAGTGAVLGETATIRESGADTVAAASGSLPFTGLDLILLVVGGLAALLAGIALRRSLARGTNAVS